MPSCPFAEVIPRGECVNERTTTIAPLLAPESLSSNQTASTSVYAVERIESEGMLHDLPKDWSRLSSAAVAPNVFMTYDLVSGVEPAPRAGGEGQESSSRSCTEEKRNCNRNITARLHDLFPPRPYPAKAPFRHPGVGLQRPSARR